MNCMNVTGCCVQEEALLKPWARHEIRHQCVSPAGAGERRGEAVQVDEGTDERKSGHEFPSGL